MKTAKTTKTKTIKPTATKSRVAAPKATVAPKAKATKSKATAAKKITAPTLMPTPMSKPAISTEEIARRAYAIWEQQGRPSGKEREHWLLAEQQLQAA